MVCVEEEGLRAKAGKEIGSFNPPSHSQGFKAGPSQENVKVLHNETISDRYMNSFRRQVLENVSERQDSTFLLSKLRFQFEKYARLLFLMSMI